MTTPTTPPSSEEDEWRATAAQGAAARRKALVPKIAGDVLAIGAIGDSSGRRGLTDGDGTSSQRAYVKASNTRPNASFGTSVAVSIDLLVVGSDEESSSASGVNGDPFNSFSPGAGAVYAY